MLKSLDQGVKGILVHSRPNQTFGLHYDRPQISACLRNLLTRYARMLEKTRSFPFCVLCRVLAPRLGW